MINKQELEEYGIKKYNVIKSDGGLDGYTINKLIEEANEICQKHNITLNDIRIGSEVYYDCSYTYFYYNVPKTEQDKKDEQRESKIINQLKSEVATLQRALTVLATEIYNRTGEDSIGRWEATALIEAENNG